MHLQPSLAAGFLPAELPVSFSAATFARAAPNLTPMAKMLWTAPVRYSLARAGGVRRAMEIPNPMAQLAIAQLCSAHWPTLQRITARSPISLSRPTRRRQNRSLGYFRDLSERSEIAVSRMPGGSVTLRTDISQFYPSVYTHAVDWAVRGKSAAKRAMRANTLGSQLDKRLQESRSGQTIGISIGPDTSWLVSELILARVDEALCKQHKSVATHAFRYVDDLTFYASSTAEAHDVLGSYGRLLSEYELSLNPNKVSVRDGLEPADASWIGPLRQARFRDESDDRQSKDLIDLFTLAFDAARQYPTEGALSYAIKRCNPFPAGKKSWPLYRDLVVAAISQDPSTLRHVYEVLIFARSHGMRIDSDRLVEVLNSTCVRHAELDHGYEVAWLLTILRDLDLPVDPTAANKVASMSDNVSLVLLLDAIRHSKALNSVDIDSVVRRAERKGALSSADWLLAYECRAAKWCAPKVWDGIPQWRETYLAGVRFLISKPLSSKRSLIKRSRPAFLTHWSYS